MRATNISRCPDNIPIGKVIFDNHEKIERLERLLAIELQRAAKMLKENTKLETKLELVRKQRDYWRKRYEKLNAGNKVCYNRDEAMAVSAMPSTPEE